MKIAFAGAFAARLAEPTRSRLPPSCEVVVGDEAGLDRIVGRTAKGEPPLNLVDHAG